MEIKVSFAQFACANYVQNENLLVLNAYRLLSALKIGDLETIKNYTDHFDGNRSRLLSAKLPDGTTPAYVAACYGHTHILEYLRINHVDLSQRPVEGEHEGETPIFGAASSNQISEERIIETLKYMHEECGVSLCGTLSSGICLGETLVFTAAFHGKARVLKYLKENSSVDLSMPLTTGLAEGATLAYVAAANAHISVLRVLQEYGVPLTEPLAFGEYEGETPATVAAYWGHEEVQSFLR